MVCRLERGARRCFFPMRLTRAALKLLLTSNTVLPQSQKHKMNGDGGKRAQLRILGGTSKKGGGEGGGGRTHCRKTSAENRIHLN